MASLGLFYYRYYFGKCSSELTQLVPLPFSRRRYTRYSDKLNDFSVTIPRCYKDVYVNRFRTRTVQATDELQYIKATQYTTSPEYTKALGTNMFEHSKEHSHSHKE